MTRPVFVDTNILVYSRDEASALFNGLRGHDAYLAAVMKGHHVETIMTVNTDDFQGITGISPVAPQDWGSLLPSKDTE